MGGWSVPSLCVPVRDGCERRREPLAKVPWMTTIIFFFGLPTHTLDPIDPLMSKTHSVLEGVR